MWLQYNYEIIDNPGKQSHDVELETNDKVGSAPLTERKIVVDRYQSFANVRGDFLGKNS